MLLQKKNAAAERAGPPKVIGRTSRPGIANVVIGEWARPANS